MTITEHVQELLKDNNKIAVFAARGVGKSYTSRELRMRLSEDALVVDDAEVRARQAEEFDDAYTYLLDCALGDGVDIVLLGTPDSYYDYNTFDDTWTKLTVTGHIQHTYRKPNANMQCP